MTTIFQIFRWLTPGDKILISLCLILSGLSFWIVRATTTEGTWAVVQVQGKEIARMPLNQNQEFEALGLLGKTMIKIREKQVSIESSPCPHKLCTQMGPISRTGQILACVPNRVMVFIQGPRASFDFITE